MEWSVSPISGIPYVLRIEGIYQSHCMFAGKFGPIYEKAEVNPVWKIQNEERYKVLDKQMAIYTAEGIGQYRQPSLAPSNSYFYLSMEYLGV